MISGEKGQITVEAVLILGFFIMIFVGVTLPMAFDARRAAVDTTVLADARFATEQIASAANTIVVNGSKRTIEVYVPGYNSGAIKIGTRICTDGSYVNTTVAIKHSKANEIHNISSKLYGSGWSLSSVSGTDYIAELNGTRYTLVFTYKSINSTTSNSLSTSCSSNLLSALP